MINNHDDFENNKQNAYSLKSLLLDGEALKRHFIPVPRKKMKLLKFAVSDAFNVLKSTKKQNTEKFITIKKESYELMEESNSIDDLELEAREAENQEESWNRWSEIAPGILLGAIPDASFINEIENYSHKNHPTKPLYIITVLDEFEMGVPSKIQLTEYKKRGILHHLLPMTDFGGGGTTKESILQLVYLIRQIIEQGGSIYIHCKAGRARSSMVLAAYFAIYPPSDARYQQYDLKGAIEYIKKRRNQIDLHDEKVPHDAWDKLHLGFKTHQIEGIGKLEKASQAIAYHRELQSEQARLYSLENNNNILRHYEKELPIDAFNTKCSNENIRVAHGQTPLSTLEFKNHLIQLDSFKLLKIKGTYFEGKRAEYMNQLLEEIVNATNDNWFIKRHVDKNNTWRKLFHNKKTTYEVREILNQLSEDIKNYKREYKNIHKDDEIPVITITDNNQFLFKENIRKITIYVTYIHDRSLSFLKNNIKTTGDDFLNKLDKFKYTSQLDIKTATSLLNSLDELEQQIEKRKDKKFINKFPDYKQQIANFRQAIIDKIDEKIMESEDEEISNNTHSSHSLSNSK